MAHHIIPASLILLGEHLQTVIAIARLIYGIHQELSRIDATHQPSATNILHYAWHILLLHKTQRKREQIGVQRYMVAIYTIAIDTLFFVKQELIKHPSQYLTLLFQQLRIILFANKRSNLLQQHQRTIMKSIYYCVIIS